MSQKTLNLCLERYNFVKFGETTKSSHTVLCINNANNVNSVKYRLTPASIAGRHRHGYVFTLNYDFDRPLFTIVQKSYTLDGTSGNIVFEGIDPISKGGSKYLRKVTVSPVKLSDGSYLLEVTKDEYLRIGTTGAALGDEDLESLNEKIVATGGISKSVETVGGKQVLKLDASGSTGVKEIVYFDVDPSNPPSGIYDNITVALSNDKEPVIRIDGAVYFYTSTGTDKYVFVGGYTKDAVGYTEIEVSDDDSMTSKSVDDKVFNMFLLYKTDPASPGDPPGDEDSWVCDANKHVITKDELIAAHADCRYFILNNDVDPDSNSRKYFAAVTNVSNSYVQLRFYMVEYSGEGAANFYQKTVSNDSEGRLYISDSYQTYLAGTSQAVLVSEPQSFNATQKAQGRDNIGAASASDVTALHSQVSSLSDVSAYSVKGEATVAQLNAGPSGIQAGWAYQLTDSGTLTDGTLAVVAGDTVAWDGTKWFPLVKSDYYATKTYVQNVAHSIAPEFDPTKPNDEGGYAYYTGEIVSNNGATYRFKVNHSSGAWNASEVERYNLTSEISKNDVSFVSSFAIDIPEIGLLKSDGTLNPSATAWRTFYKVPVKQGDILELKNLILPSSDDYANVVIYATDGTLLEHYMCSNFFRKFEQDGFVSFMSSTSTNFTESVKFSPLKFTDTIFHKQALNFKNFVEDERKILFETPCILKNDGTLYFSDIAKTLYKVPVKQGCKLVVGNSGMYTTGYATLVFYDNGGDVIYNHTTSSYTYIAPSDGFVSISYRVTQTNFFVHFEDSSGVFEVADLSARNEKNLLQQKDLTLEVLKNCLKKGAVKIDGTFVSLPVSGWRAIYKLPLKEGAILSARNLGENMSPGFASYVVTDLSGNVIDYGVSSKFFLEASQDCFVSLTGADSIFDYSSDVFVGLSDFYTYSKFISSLFDETKNDQSKYIYGSIAQVLKKCTFIGDSITCGFIHGGDILVNSETAKALKQNWAEYLCLGRGMTCTNIAVGGSSTHDWRYGGTVSGVTVSIDNSNIPTDAYFVALGVNDKRSSLSLGSSSDIESDYNENADSMYGNYDYIVRKIHSFNPYAKIFVLTTGANESMNNYNNAIRYVASLYDYVYLIDLWDEEFFTSSFCLNNLWIGGHFTPIGESCLAQIVWKKLNELIYENISSMTYIPYYPGM